MPPDRRSRLATLLICSLLLCLCIPLLAFGSVPGGDDVGDDEVLTAAADLVSTVSAWTEAIPDGAQVAWGIDETVPFDLQFVLMDGGMITYGGVSGLTPSDGWLYDDFGDDGDEVLDLPRDSWRRHVDTPTEPGSPSELALRADPPYPNPDFAVLDDDPMCGLLLDVASGRLLVQRE